MDQLSNGFSNLKIASTAISRPASAFFKMEQGVCSIFSIEIKPGSVAYRYDVEIANIKRNRSLTKASDDGQRALNRTLCYEILAAAYYATNAFGMKAGAEVVYDCRSTIYTSVPIKKAIDLTVLPGQLNDFVRERTKSSDFLVKLSPNLECPKLDLCDLTQYQTKKSLFHEDRSLRTFLEMLTNQAVLDEDSFSLIGNGKLMDKNPKNFQNVENGIVLRSGINKGVRVIQSTGKPKPALVLDTCVSPFYAAQTLEKTINELLARGVNILAKDFNSRVLPKVKDIRVEVSYAKHRTFDIGTFTDKPLSELRVVYKGTKMSVPEFYKLEHNIDLKFVNWPGVIPNNPPAKGRLEVFPIEELHILPDQRVSLERMTGKLSDMLLKVNSILPHERLSKIMSRTADLKIFSPQNSLLAAFGVKILRESNQVAIGVREAPRIKYANRTVVVNAEKAEWRRDGMHSSYIEKAEIKNWLVMYAQGQEKFARQFVDLYVKHAIKKGLKLGNPIITTFNANWQQAFERFVNKNIEFVMLIDSKREDTHGLLKYYEALYKVCTQQISLERATEVVTQNKSQILDNILNKSNLKNFGLNFEPIFESAASPFALQNNNVLVVGYDVAHPGSASAHERRKLKVSGILADSVNPSVVGISANTASNPHAFVGDYFFQESRREAVDVIQLSERMTWILQQLAENRPKAARPQNVFILRDGLSEGQFSMAIDDELKALKDGCRRFSPNYNPKFIFVIGSKRHYKRFFKINQGRVENLAPGSVVCEKVVREDCPEFFLQSHFPLKGVAKPVQYSVPHDEIGVTQDQLQGLLNGLAYSHQIVNSAVSLPEPVFQADELAKRGRNNFMTMKAHMPQLIPRSSMHANMVDVRELTNRLSYRYSKLCGARFTA